MQRPQARGLFRKRGYKDEGCGAPLFAESSLQLDAAHVRHSYVRDHARGFIYLARPQEFRRRRKCADGVAPCPEEAVSRYANGRVVVYDRYDWTNTPKRFVPGGNLIGTWHEYMVNRWRSLRSYTLV